MPALCVAPTKAVGGGVEGTHVARPTGGVTGEGAHVGNQQDEEVRQASTDPGTGLRPQGGRRMEPYGASGRKE